MSEVFLFVAQLNESLSRVNAKVIDLSANNLFVDYNGTECHVSFGFKKRLDPNSEFSCAVAVPSMTDGAPLTKSSNLVNICCFVAKMADSQEVASEVTAILKEFATGLI